MKSIYVATLPTALALASAALALPTRAAGGEFKSDFSDAVVVSSKLAGARNECLYNLFNIYSNAIADGLVVNGALTGLGTESPAGKQLESDSLYFQLLRIYSAFDWEMGRQLRFESADRCLPSDVNVASGVFSRAYLSSLAKPDAEEVGKLKRAIATLTPEAPTFEVVQIDQSDAPACWPASTNLFATHRQHSSRGSWRRSDMSARPAGKMATSRRS